MTPETEGRLIRLLVNLENSETSRASEMKSIRSMLGAMAEKLEKFTERIFKVEAEQGRQNGRLHHVEDRVVRLEDSVEDVVETTGQYELANLREEVAKKNAEMTAMKEAKSHWSRWGIQTLVGVVIAVAASVVGWVLRGM